MQQPMPVLIQQPYGVSGGSVTSVNVKATRGLGIVQLVLGLLCCIFGVFASVFVDIWVRYIGTSIWGGLLIIISGVLGVSSAFRPTSRCLNGINMAFAILASLSSFIQVAFSAVALSLLSYDTMQCWDYYTKRYISCQSNVNQNNGAGLALYSILLIITLAEFVVSIAVSVYCCKQACCGPQTQGMVIQQPHPQGMMPTRMTDNRQMTYVAVPATSGTPASHYHNAAMQQGAPQQQQMTYTTTAGYAQPANPTAMTYGSMYSQGYAPAPAQAHAPAYSQAHAAAHGQDQACAPPQTKQAFAEDVPPPYSRQ